MEDQRTKSYQSLQEALGTYERLDAARFHMPGHKGRGMAGFWRGELPLWDVTELSNTDNLHAPQGAIAAAQSGMAEAYGAKASFFVVNGSTNAVHAMILALDETDKLLLSRDCHKAALNGAALRGIETSYLRPDYDEATGLPGMVTPEALDRALQETGATAALITSPNAYGFCADVKGLADAAHAHDALLLVDAAHGAHFPFSDALPQGLGGIADVFAHSQHKTMDALTQAASLHLGECRIKKEQLQRALAMTETNSPSYLLMASLDWSVYMAKRRDWTGQVRRCIDLEQKIEAMEGFAVPHDPVGNGVYDRDRTRLVIDVSARGYTGYQAQALLEEKGIYIEMADARRLVLITAPVDEPIWYDRLLEALDALPKRKPIRKNAQSAMLRTRKNEQPVDIRTATFGASEQTPLSQAQGRIASEPIGVYPPGIALVMPGERIETDAINCLAEQEQNGASLFGVRGGMIQVMKEDGKTHA